MSLASLLTQTATVTPRTQDTDEDEYGTPLLVDGTPVAYPCRLEQSNLVGGSIENRADMDRVVTQFTCYLPATAVVHHLDTFTIDGVTFEVDGEPAVERSPAGAHHIVAILRDIEGG